MNQGSQPLVRLIRSAWAETNPTLRWLAIAMWISGTAVALAGVAGDVWEWWSDWPFATNLLSSVAGALIGIPVALFVVQQLSTSQAEAIVARRERTIAAGLVVQLRANVERVIPGLFPDFGFLWSYSRTTQQTIGLLHEIGKRMSEGRNIDPELEKRIAKAISEHGDFTRKWFPIERVLTEARGIWYALRPYLVTMSLESPANDYLNMAGTIDADLDAVNRASGVGYREIEELWSNTLPGEELIPGQFTMDANGARERLGLMKRATEYLEAFAGLYANLDGITTRLVAELSEGTAPR